MDNGIILTTDNNGFIYDLGHFTYPEQVGLKGGNYFSENNGVLVTIDEKGLLYRKYEVIPSELQGKGMNYFLGKTGELFTIDKTGAVAARTDLVYPEGIKNFGGNYFVLNSEFLQVVTVGDTGAVTTVSIDTLKTVDVVAFGGSYFMTNRGVVYTIAANGTMASDAMTRVGILKKRGGNYFTDSSMSIYTVAQDGSIKVPAIPLTLSVESISKLGSNYFLDNTGKLFIVDKDGEVFERSLTDHDFKTARIISL